MKWLMACGPLLLLLGCTPSNDSQTSDVALPASTPQVHAAAADLEEPSPPVEFDFATPRAVLVSDVRVEAPAATADEWVVFATLENRSRIPLAGVDLRITVSQDGRGEISRLDRLVFDQPLELGTSLQWTGRIALGPSQQTDMPASAGVAVEQWISQGGLDHPWRPLSPDAEASPTPVGEKVHMPLPSATAKVP